MFDCIGMKLQRDFAANIASELRTAVRDCLIDFGTFTAVGNCQTTQAMAIFHDIFEQAEKPFAVKTLIAQIESKNGHFDVGILGARAIFRVLGDFGYADLAYEMIMHPDYPSYGNWIRRGATSLWEDFRSEGVIPNSRNHHFFGDISAWFISYPGGIRVNPRLASADEVDIKPCFIEKLSHVYARHDIPCGNVSVEWTRTDEGVIELKISAPDGAKGFITLPAGYKFDNSAAFCRLKTGEFRVIKAEQKDRNTD
ncbi:hypothetical protein SDC9_156390 [bioreactor metagenome]|uniref:alpha-L-rhamnosidase n=1 Tax=bioreactor metagenome TaxID=1076179 RepID=A0A645F6E7_9ZZZZ